MTNGEGTGKPSTERRQTEKKRLHFMLPVFIGLSIFLTVMLAWLLGWNPLHFLLSSPGVPAQTTVINELTSSGEVINRTYSWNYDRRNWSWNLAIPENLYDYFNRMERAPVSDYSLYATHPLDDVFLDEVAHHLNQEASKSGYEDADRLQFAAAFVQELPYLREIEEYPKYPIETLVDKGGDCEDTAILTAGLLDAMGYDVVLINLSSPSPEEPGHMAVGVSLPGFSGGAKVVFDGKDYYYLETTCVSDLGYMPDDYQNYDLSVYEVVPKTILKLSSLRWTVYPHPMGTVDVQTTVTNWGTLGAVDIQVRAFFQGYESEGKLSLPFDLEYGHRISPVTITKLGLPSQGPILCVQIVLDGEIVDEWSTSLS